MPWLYDDNNKSTSSGKVQSESVQVEDWMVGENVRNFVFHTPASNTGARKGAIVRVMNGLQKVVFLCGCRYHISELVVKGFWYSLFEMDL